MWIARNRDAHAWVEAFDQERSQWVIVESTPGVDVPKSLWLNDKVTENDLARTETNTQKRGGWSLFSTDLINWVTQYVSMLGNQLTTVINALAFDSIARFGLDTVPPASGFFG